MKVKINEEEYLLKEEKTVYAALIVAGITHHIGVAVAVNENVVSKSQWNTHLLQDGDQITVIKAVCGG